MTRTALHKNSHDARTHHRAGNHRPLLVLQRRALDLTRHRCRAGGKFDLEWKLVGDTLCEWEVYRKAKTTTFYDLFDAAPVPSPDDGSCPQGFTSVNAIGKHECLKLKRGMQRLAARFETHRCATAGWRAALRLRSRRARFALPAFSTCS
jgi:hypothetical protein